MKRAITILFFTLLYSTNYSLDFSGNSGYVNVGELDEFNDNGDVTIETWIKLNQEGYQYIFVLGGNGHLFLNIDYDGKPKFQVVIGGNTGYYCYGNDPLELGRWYHIAGVYDNAENTAKIYVDGIFQDSVVTPNASFYHPNSNNSSIGSYYHPFEAVGDYLNGYMAGFSLSQNIKYIQNFIPEFPIMPTDDMVGFWPMNTGSGSTLTDDSGSGNNGSINSGVSWSSDVPSLGCTDEYAENYDNLANIDNGSCEYPPEVNYNDFT